MTWIVKGTGGYEYACHPDGEMFGPELEDAYRYTSKPRATRVKNRLNRIMTDGVPYRVVRLRKRGPLRDALTSIVEYETRRSTCPWMLEMINIARAALTKPVARKEAP